jgi:hypothetical protein
VQQIAELGAALRSAQERIASQRAEMARVEAVPVAAEPREAPDAVFFSDCAGDLPAAVEPDLRRILNTPGMRNATKLRSVVRILRAFYQKQIDALNSELSEKVVGFTAAFADFVQSCGMALLKREVCMDDFVADPGIKAKMLAALRTVCGHAASVYEMEKRVSDLEERNQSLTDKLRKYKRQVEDREADNELIRYSSEIEGMQARIIELENEVRQLTAERNRLQQAMEGQRREFLEKLQAAKSSSLGSYEEIIAQLKQRCGEQRETIRKLARQIGATASGV